MIQYSIEPKTRKHVKRYGFLSFIRKFKEKQLLDTRLDSLKTTAKKVVHKTDEFLGNKTADAVTNSNNDKCMIPKPVHEITIPPEKKRRN